MCTATTITDAAEMMLSLIIAAAKQGRLTWRKAELRFEIFGKK